MISYLEDIPRPLYRIARSIFPSLRRQEIELRAFYHQYAPVVGRHCSYFNELTEAQQKRFLRRIYFFKRKKRFHYVGLNESPDIPVLIGAAAVQLTFGLRAYRMSFFKDIYIMADAYTYGNSSTPWAGHVNRKGIYISWKHFLQGYRLPHDRSNVGLHEMAHALEYVHFLDNTRADDHFVEYFTVYKRVLEERIMPKLANQTNGLLSPEARNSFHECWAECVELFFENPADLNLHYPELYKSVQLLLNQDPLNGIKILQAAVAGGMK